MLWRRRLLLIRAEQPSDEQEIARLNVAAFGGPGEAAIVDAIRGSDRWIDGGSLVAVETDDRLVGHLLLSQGDLVGAEGGTRRIWVVGPVAVHPSRQRQGVGAALMRAAIGLATERGQPLLCLLGHADYYPRFGFEPARAIGIQPPQPWPDGNWLALRLPAWTPELRGTARFAPAFGAG